MQHLCHPFIQAGLPPACMCAPHSVAATLSFLNQACSNLLFSSKPVRKPQSTSLVAPYQAIVYGTTRHVYWVGKGDVCVQGPTQSHGPLQADAMRWGRSHILCPWEWAGITPHQKTLAVRTSLVSSPVHRIHSRT